MSDDPVLVALREADGDYTDPGYIRALSEWNIANAWRPRDEFDVDVDPASYRGHVLAYLDALTALRATKRGRIVWMVARIVAKLRSSRTA